jgi:TRAP-type C4-dicarboxylate transport system substrate-binding protein
MHAPIDSQEIWYSEWRLNLIRFLKGLYPKIERHLFVSLTLTYRERRRKMKKHFLVVVTVLFLVILCVGLKHSYAASEKPIELRFSTYYPPMHPLVTQLMTPWAKQLEEQTNGRVKVVFYAGGTLGAPKDQYDMVIRGIADFAQSTPGLTPGRFPLTSVLELPISIPSSKTASRVLWELYEKYMKQEYSDVKVLMLCTTDPFNLHFKTKTVKTLADIKGLKIRVMGAEQLEAVRAWGASPLQISAAEIYDALQKGMFDGITGGGYGSLKPFKLEELLKHHTILNMFCTTQVIVMNLKTWSSLPPDVQKIIDELSGIRLASKMGEINDTVLGYRTWEEARKAGHDVYELPPVEKGLWIDKAKPICDAWVAEKEKMGLPGKKVYEEAVSLLEKYSK